MTNQPPPLEPDAMGTHINKLFAHYNSGKLAKILRDGEVQSKDEPEGDTKDSIVSLILQAYFYKKDESSEDNSNIVSAQ